MPDSRSRSDSAATAPSSTKPHWLSRTTLILIPVHAAGFVLLYLGMMTIVRSEILETHGSHARILLREAINDLHPAMESGDRQQVRSHLAAIATAHNLMGLQLYSAAGETIAGQGGLAVDVAAFAAGEAHDDFWFNVEHGDLHMHGIQRIVSHGDCSACHDADATLGVATIDVDLSVPYTTSRERLRLNLALLITAWGIAIGLINVATTWIARRSVADLRSDVDGEGGGHSSVSQVSRAMLDPLSRELYDSLRSVLEQQRERDEEVVSKLYHTERLASLGKLAAGLAHEIKNPLAGVQGSIELLRDETDDAEQQELYQQMLIELKRVNDTIHALLHFARPAPARPAATPVAEFLADSVQLLRPGFSKRGIDIEISVAPTVDSFSLDRSQIRQVLLNLVHNAADAIGENGIIQLCAALLPDDGGLLMTVRDNGPGISAENAARIFEPFHTTKFAGTGLGLSVARSLVERHGGRLELRSAKGQGAEFLIILPPPPDPAADEEV